MALYMEDLHPGQVFITPGRTVTEADVVSFAAWTGDYNPLHTDSVYAGGTRFGQRIAHGLLGPALCIGLLSRLGVFDGSAIALLGVDDWRFVAPIFIGDTVHAEVEIVEVRVTSTGTSAVVRRAFSLVKQDGTVAQRGNLNVLVASADGVGADATPTVS